LVPRIDIAAGRGHISVDATTPDGGSRNNLRLQTHIIGPDLSTEDITLDQTAAGQYEGSFPAEARGAYLVSVSEAEGEQGAVAGAVNSYSPEFNIASQDEDLLVRLSEITGGQIVRAGESASAELFSRRSTKTIPHEIWEPLILAALILLPFDVGVRRVLITRKQLSDARVWIESRLRRRSISSVDATVTASIAKLKDARARVVLGDSGDDSEPQTRQLPASQNQVSTAPSGDVAKDTDPLASRLLDARRKRRE
jgi:hypothetical protein